MTAVADYFEEQDRIMEMLKREVMAANGSDQAQRERWVLIRRQFKISKQLDTIEKKLNDLLGRLPASEGLQK